MSMKIMMSQDKGNEMSRISLVLDSSQDSAHVFTKQSDDSSYILNSSHRSTNKDVSPIKDASFLNQIKPSEIMDRLNNNSIFDATGSIL